MAKLKLLLILGALIGIAGCAPDRKPGASERLEVISKQDFDTFYTVVLRDIKTGKQYMVVRFGYAGAVVKLEDTGAR